MSKMRFPGALLLAGGLLILLQTSFGCGSSGTDGGDGAGDGSAGASANGGRAGSSASGGAAAEAGVGTVELAGAGGEAGSVSDPGAAGDGGAATMGPQDFPNPVQGSESDGTLLGTDADGDGVRDDLATFIEAMESDPQRQTALKSFARESTGMMLLAAEPDATRDAAHDQAQRVALTLGCLHDLYAGHTSDAGAYLEQLRYALYNNAARLTAYNHASTLVSGSILHTSRGCDPTVTGVQR